MPNWAYSKITITGKEQVVSEVKERLAKPYITPWANQPDQITKKPVPAEEVTGDFLLWNIISPTDLRAYLELDKREFQEIVEQNNLEETIPADLRAEHLSVRAEDFQQSVADGSFFAKLQKEMAESNGWYEWNCRNWGTKWETDGGKAKLVNEWSEPLTEVEQDYTKPIRANQTLIYRMESAWSPPIEALHHLHQQYPDLTISIRSIDESDNFAMEGQWFQIPTSPNEYVLHYNEGELDITHELGIELRGYCNLECCWDNDDE